MRSATFRPSESTKAQKMLLTHEAPARHTKNACAAGIKSCAITLRARSHNKTFSALNTSRRAEAGATSRIVFSRQGCNARDVAITLGATGGSTQPDSAVPSLLSAIHIGELSFTT